MSHRIYAMFSEVSGLEPRKKGPERKGPHDPSLDGAKNPHPPKGGPAGAFFRQPVAAL